MRPRIRSIKPEFFHDEDLYDVERATGLSIRVAFAGLWTVADREGRFEWRPRALKAHILPFDEVDFENILNALAENGFIVRYEVSGRAYGVIPSFPKHQVVNPREAPSSLPRPVRTRAPRVPHASPDLENPARGEGEGELEGEGNGNGTEGGTALVELRSTREDVIAQNAETQRQRQTATQGIVTLVFDYWRLIMGHPNAVLDSKREKRIRARLREAAGDVSQLLYAIDGARRDDFLMGRDERSPRKYDGIETVLRDRGQVERLMQLAGANGQVHPAIPAVG